MTTKDLREGNTHYVDNEKFQEHLVIRRNKVDSQIVDYHPDVTLEALQSMDFKLERKPLMAALPSVLRVDEYIGSCILKISTNLRYHRYFINYPFADEMVGDGMENCIRYIDNYDCVLYKNPFAYYTQICYFAFQRKKLYEKRKYEELIKYREKMMIDEDIQDKYAFQDAVVDELWIDEFFQEPQDDEV